MNKQNLALVSLFSRKAVQVPRTFCRVTLDDASIKPNDNLPAGQLNLRITTDTVAPAEFKEGDLFFGIEPDGTLVGDSMIYQVQFDNIDPERSRYIAAYAVGVTVNHLKALQGFLPNAPEPI